MESQRRLGSSQKGSRGSPGYFRGSYEDPKRFQVRFMEFKSRFKVSQGNSKDFTYFWGVSAAFRAASVTVTFKGIPGGFMRTSWVSGGLSYV